MAPKVWTAAELEQMTPAELDAVFATSLVTDPASVPPAFLDRVRRRAQDRIESAELPDR